MPASTIVGVAFRLTASWLGSTYRWLSITGSSFWDRFHFVLPFIFELTTSGFLTGTDLQVQVQRPRARDAS